MEKRNICRGIALALFGAAVLVAGARAIGPARADPPKIGINVLLTGPATDAVLAELGQHGTVLDVIPEIHAVTLRADESSLSAIQALPCVAAANPDREIELAGIDPLPVSDLAAGASDWDLDAINVTDHGVGRTVAYDGTGVYVAVIDTGLPHNWREYFPEQRIATQFARAYSGGFGQAVAVSPASDKWSHDTDGHGGEITSVILGFAYAGSDEQMPRYVNGVAPRATVIPVSFHNKDSNEHFSSVAVRAVLYVTGLKTSGALGTAPLVINASWGEHEPDAVLRAAVDYAIAHGVLFVAAAGNDGDAGMIYPAAYPEVISVGATEWVGQFPADDPTTYRWMLRDVPEGDASQHLVPPFSARALAGQELDVLAPGFPVPGAFTLNGTADYTFARGTSQSCPHVSGTVALMLQKNAGLTQAQAETILEGSALSIAPGSGTARWPILGAGNPATWDDHSSIVGFVDLTATWGANATGHGLVQADAAIAATPDP